MFFLYLVLAWSAIIGIVVGWLGYPIGSPQVAIPIIVSMIILFLVICRRDDGRHFWELKQHNNNED